VAKTCSRRSQLCSWEKQGGCFVANRKVFVLGPVQVAAALSYERGELDEN
jgi:hypothetical protein